MFVFGNCYWSLNCVLCAQSKILFKCSFGRSYAFWTTNKNSGIFVCVVIYVSYLYHVMLCFHLRGRSTSRACHFSSDSFVPGKPASHITVTSLLTLVGLFSFSPHVPVFYLTVNGYVTCILNSNQSA